MKRPSFQFYPADWRANSNLRRCSWAARGAWIEVLALMHDSDEYGVLRWPLAEIAQAVGCPIELLSELAIKGVLKGSDAEHEAHTFTPRHAGRNGDPIVLVAPGNGPCWFSSRMVDDEHRRTVRGAGSRFVSLLSESVENPMLGDAASPKGGFGARHGSTPNAEPSARQGDGASSSSSSSSSKKRTTSGETDHGSMPAGSQPGFTRWWAAWPAGDRKTAKAKCAVVWAKHRLESRADELVGKIESLKATKAWRDGFDPAPLTYLNQRRFDDDVPKTDGVPAASADWWTPAGFRNQFEAENEGCRERNAHLFRDGHRITDGVAA